MILTKDQILLILSALKKVYGPGYSEVSRDELKVILRFLETAPWEISP